MSIYIFMARKERLFVACQFDSQFGRFGHQDYSGLLAMVMLRCLQSLFQAVGRGHEEAMHLIIIKLLTRIISACSAVRQMA